VSNRAVLPARSVRAEIVAFLSGAAGHEGRISATAKYIATSLGFPVRVVREELEKMALERTARSRTHRSGDVLYRLTDAVDDRWDAVRGPAHSFTR
jgi:hypothetical protein